MMVRAEMEPGQSRQDKAAPKAPRCGVLVDDDPTFSAIMEQVAGACGISLTSCETLADLQGVVAERDFGFAIVDYHLEGTNGMEIAAFLRQASPDLQILLVSADRLRPPREGWPAGVIGARCKADGCMQIIGACGGAAP